MLPMSQRESWRKVSLTIWCHLILSLLCSILFWPRPPTINRGDWRCWTAPSMFEILVIFFDRGVAESIVQSIELLLPGLLSHFIEHFFIIHGKIRVVFSLRKPVDHRWSNAIRIKFWSLKFFPWTVMKIFMLLVQSTFTAPNRFPCAFYRGVAFTIH